LQVLAEFEVKTEDQLYKTVRDFNWPHYFDVNQTFAVTPVVHSYLFTHSHYVALKTKDAIADRFRAEVGRRPNVNLLTPHFRINIRIQGKKATLSLDSSGDSLHKRGYRIQTVDAPINEVLAAGMLKIAGWQGDRPFLDPMCGSGTIPIEAALMAAHIPANFYRKDFGFHNWKNYEPERWSSIRAAAQELFRPVTVPIMGYDKSLRAVKIIDDNLRAAHLSTVIEVEKHNFLKVEAPHEAGLLVMNPPYDERLSNADIDAFYKKIGDHLKQAFSGWDAWMISSNLDALKHVGLRPSQKTTLFNGPLECKYQHYELYQGSRR
jgi:putative N6-adenine-specific DNA methylase